MKWGSALKNRERGFGIYPSQRQQACPLPGFRHKGSGISKRSFPSLNPSYERHREGETSLFIGWHSRFSSSVLWATGIGVRILTGQIFPGACRQLLPGWSPSPPNQRRRVPPPLYILLVQTTELLNTKNAERGTRESLRLLGFHDLFFLSFSRLFPDASIRAPRQVPPHQAEVSNLTVSQI